MLRHRAPDCISGVPSEGRALPSSQLRSGTHSPASFQTPHTQTALPSNRIQTVWLKTTSERLALPLPTRPRATSRPTTPMGVKHSTGQEGGGPGRGSPDGARHTHGGGRAGHERATGMFEKQQQPFVDLEWEGQSPGDGATARGRPPLVTREPWFLSKALGRLRIKERYSF